MITALITILVLVAPNHAQGVMPERLRIGTTEPFIEEGVPEDCDATAVEDIHRAFIQNETGFANDFSVVENYQILAERLARGRLHVGIFMGYEFAWAQAKYPKLKPLAISVNFYPYRYPCIVVHRDSTIFDLAGLKGKPLGLPRNGLGYFRLFVEGQGRLAGHDSRAFVGPIATFEDVETLLDDVVDGQQQAAVLDRRGLESYQRRKPARFARLKKLLESPALPPPLMAYHEGGLDSEALQRLQDGLTNVHKTTKGKWLLTLFRQTSFDRPPSELDCVLTDMRKVYPAPSLNKIRDVQPAVGQRHRHPPADTLLLVGKTDTHIDTFSVGSAPPSVIREPKYYLCVFAYDSVPRRPHLSHTFATFIKHSGHSSEARTISWMPESKVIQLARCNSEPGVNLDLNRTLRFAQSMSARVYEWGPYEIQPELYERGVRQFDKLNDKRIGYKALDAAWRPGIASNCIHAVCDIDGDDGFLTVDGAYGRPATAWVVEHLSRWVIQPHREHSWINETLGLSRYPIVRVSFDSGRERSSK
jgi:ABC-type phosphate/phosphonate transport system substrate-binding protein